jgi:hypothetical protein
MVGTGRELPAALNPKPTGASFVFFSESFVPKVEDDGEKYVMVSSIKFLNLCTGSSVRGMELYRAPETDELFSYRYIGNSEVHAIKHLAKRKSLQAIAFDGICVKALFLAGASAPSYADDARRHRQDKKLVRGLRINREYTWNVIIWCQGG